MFANPIEVVNSALSRIGAPRIASMNDSSKQAQVADAAYEPIVRAWLTRHVWSFATRTDSLQFQQEVTGRWTHQYALATDVLNVRVVRESGKRVLYEMQSDKILTDSKYSELQAVVAWRAPEGDWPADFTEGIVSLLKAEFYAGLREEEPQAERDREKGERQLLIAATRDARQYSGPDIDDALRDPSLVRAWRGTPIGSAR